ncbi:hypothetical protein [Mycobacteroides sp. LB1]|uniref:DUF7161 family protein n=1 Tax=Mycobacteroides sp. LB1 TaxID=2750814 RepID=UPI0015DF7E88|nr:hypothetical protein [Mycobacteroides sp. LB1]
MSQHDVDRIAELLHADSRLNAAEWDRYVYFIYIDEGVVTSSGFRFVGRRWYPGPTNCHGAIEDIMEAIRNEGVLPAQDLWNAAVVTVRKGTPTGVLYPFLGIDAEAWEMTPDNQADIADRAFRLFGEGGVDQPDDWEPVRVDQTGLKGRTAKLLVSEPTDDAGWPAELPPDTTEVIVFDNEPTPLLTVRVFVPGMDGFTFVRFDQLAVHAD